RGQRGRIALADVAPDDLAEEDDMVARLRLVDDAALEPGDRLIEDGRLGLEAGHWLALEAFWPVLRLLRELQGQVLRAFAQDRDGEDTGRVDVLARDGTRLHG